MKLHLAIAALALGGPLTAQNVQEEPKVDPVLAAIQEFNRRDQEKPNEVTVVLDPAGLPPAAPVLVTGTPPENPAAVPDEVLSAEAPKPETGLAVHVEKLQVGKGTIDPAQVKLLAPFPAKPLAETPAGWKLDASGSAPPFTREVELSPGSKITLTIRPHLLVPEADGANVFTISEPGYDNALGYQQTATVGAILANSIGELDDSSRAMGTAIDQLQQLLISLPKPEPQPQPQPEDKPATPRKK